MRYKKNYALSAYPLSQEFQNHLKSRVNENLEFLLLSEIRQKGIKGNLKYFFKNKPEKFYLVIEDGSSQVLLPILKIMAKLLLPNEIYIVMPQLEIKKINFLNVLYSTGLCIVASLMNQFALFKTKRDVKLLSTSSESVCHFENRSTSQEILFLNANFWFGVKAGGSVGHIAGVVNGLIRRNLHVDYASLSQNPLLKGSLIELPLMKTFGFPSELNFYNYSKLVAHKIISHAKPWKWIYQRLSIANYSGVMISRKLKIPLIIEYNGSEAWVSKNWGRPLRYQELAEKVEDICLKHASLIVTISAVLKQELIDRGIPESKIVFYPNCIDPEMFNPLRFSSEDINQLRARYEILPDEKIFTFLGTFGVWHGVDILAQAIKLLIQEKKTWLIENKVKFMLVGDGLKMPEIKSILSVVDYEPFVIFTGLIPQNEAPRYLAIADCLLSPHVANQDGSRFFGSPTKLFEYMAMSKPIIASNLEQIGDILNTGVMIKNLKSGTKMKGDEVAILCEPGDVQDIFDAIHYTVNNLESQRFMGRNARKEALDKYTWDKHVNAILTQIQHLEVYN